MLATHVAQGDIIGSNGLPCGLPRAGCLRESQADWNVWAG